MASVAFAQDQGWRTAVAVTVAVPAEKRKDASASSATLDGEAAIAIYLAKAARTPRDSTSSLLAAQYKVTMKAVRDVWNLRTWVWTTMPYWTRSSDDLVSVSYLYVDSYRVSAESRAGEWEF